MIFAKATITDFEEFMGYSTDLQRKTPTKNLAVIDCHIHVTSRVLPKRLVLVASDIFQNTDCGFNRTFDSYLNSSTYYRILNIVILFYI